MSYIEATIRVKPTRVTIALVLKTVSVIIAIHFTVTHEEKLFYSNSKKYVKFDRIFNNILLENTSPFLFKFLFNYFMLVFISLLIFRLMSLLFYYVLLCCSLFIWCAYFTLNYWLLLFLLLIILLFLLL